MSSWPQARRSSWSWLVRRPGRHLPGMPARRLRQCASVIICGISYDIQGWSAGIATDSEDTLRFPEMTGIRAHGIL